MIITQHFWTILHACMHKSNKFAFLTNKTRFLSMIGRFHLTSPRKNLNSLTMIFIFLLRFMIIFADFV